MIFPFSKNDVGTYDIQIILSNGEEERKYPVTIIIEFPDDEGEETVDPDEPDEEDEDYNEEDYSCGLKIIESFAEYAKRNTITDMIATTEY